MSQPEKAMVPYLSNSNLFQQMLLLVNKMLKEQLPKPLRNLDSQKWRRQGLTLDPREKQMPMV
jgi:hypothetical protein